MTPPTSTPATAKALMTADEFWDFVNRPENEHRNIDLIRGELFEMSRPTRLHGRVCARIAFLLELWVEKARVGYIATNDAGCVLEDDPDSVLGPDVAYYTDANSFEDVPPKWGDEPPVLAVEVLSPNDKLGKANAKIATYLRGGVKLVWLVDYEGRTVSVYRPQQNLVVLEGAAVLSGGDELPGFTRPVADFFQVPADTPAPPSP